MWYHSGMIGCGTTVIVWYAVLSGAVCLIWSGGETSLEGGTMEINVSWNALPTSLTLTCTLSSDLFHTASFLCYSSVIPGSTPFRFQYAFPSPHFSCLCILYTLSLHLPPSSLLSFPPPPSSPLSFPPPPSLSPSSLLPHPLSPHLLPSPLPERRRSVAIKRRWPDLRN